jgi:uncharacterized tellurite resistance protein B-like protein
MSFTDYITNHGRRVNRNAFVHLIQVSKIDGKFNQEEHDLLHKEGKKFGLTDPEIDNLISSEGNSHYQPPYSLEEKFEDLFNMAEMILADDIVDEKERRMIKKFAIEAGFSESKHAGLAEILIEGIRNNTDEEVLLRKFREFIIS